MGLFEQIITPRRLVVDPRNQTVETETSFMSVIVGLGNPGREYDGTRHNIGFAVLDKYREDNKFPDWKSSDKFQALISEDFRGGKKILLVKPQTFMNNSGDSLQAVQHFYKCLTSDFLVIHDELDLPFGEIKDKRGGGSAGHNGLKSIIAHIGEDFRRIRIGIKTDQLAKIDSADFVLAKFTGSEKKQLPKILTETLSKI